MNLQFFLVLILIIVSAGFLFLFWQIKQIKGNKTNGDSLDVLTKWLQGMQASVEKNTESTQKQLAESSRSLNERLDRAATVIAGVQKEVGQMSEIGRSMKDLQDFLRSPKLRGNIGEQVLKDLLKQFLPNESFYLQHRFKSGEIVDAAIKTDSGMIAIDSKFPLENFKAMSGAESEEKKALHQKDFVRDIKKHIDDIAKKYILPEEGTVDYALMYVPSESIYYEIMANIPELSDYSQTKRVLPVSPATFYAYLRAILMSFEGKKIEERAATILISLRSIKTEADKFGESLRVLTKHVNDSKNVLDVVNNRFSSLSTKISLTHSHKNSAPLLEEETTQED